ncbi:hypothetical protein [Mangrovicoccus sp. HB161399]|uniref:hypothetical protein n=1 Tax=Mangrovicoccus sp. HB161399 TaxID=2720392 RepID=UPI0015519942|nr:hypothetical protein [Mangrovicoccus sp. HB161399]
MPRTALPAALLAACLPAAAAAQEGAAPGWSGIWRNDSCGSGTDSWVLGADLELVINEGDFFAGPVAISPEPLAGWYRYIAGGTSFYIRRDGDSLIFRDLLDPDDEALSDAVNAGEVTPATHSGIWEDTAYHRCERLPAASQLLFGELAAVLLALDAVPRDCGRDAEGGSCMEGIAAALDLGGDGKLNRAELARALRAAALFVDGTGDEATELGDAAGEQVAALAAAPFLASLMLASFDYSGDGSLSAEELAADRFAGPGSDLSDALPGAAEFGAMLGRNLGTLMNLLESLPPGSFPP